MALLEVGRIARAHGIKGEVLVHLVSNRPERLAPGSVLATDAGDLEVVSSTPHQGGFIVAFAGVATRSEAEALRATVLRAEPLDEPDAYWVHELVGATVVDQAGTAHGEVASVEANPASDLLVLADGRMVPLRFVVERQPGRLVVDVPAGLLD